MFSRSNPARKKPLAFAMPVPEEEHGIYHPAIDEVLETRGFFFKVTEVPTNIRET
jgi:hypothetical protein